MAEVLVEYTDVMVMAETDRYAARACGAPADNGHWHGWLEFSDIDTGHTIRSGRETTQPNRIDTLYWATGLTAVYLEGALQRALHPVTKAAPRPAAQSTFDGPAPALAIDMAGTVSILNPFSVYRKGEALLRRQLSALSVWHLVNIIRDHELSALPSGRLNAMADADLIDMIVAAVRAQLDVRGRLPKGARASERTHA
jgi:hypothetical protein